MSVDLWWLSFADAARPAGEQNLGIAIVDAVDLPAAIKVAWATGCNPGGEVQGMRIDPTQVARLSFKLPIGRLLQPDDARALADRIGEEIGS